jgi:hypothetical protein
MANISATLRNLLLLPFLAFAIGMPVNSLEGFAALVMSVLVVVFGVPRSRNARLLAIGCLSAIGAAGVILAPPALEEGMNAFVPGYPQDAALRRDLPATVYDKGIQLFDRTYPADHRCDPRPRPFTCWLNTENRPQGERFSTAYAFSADSVWSGAKYSRRTDSVDFYNVANLRAGFVNDYLYRWYVSRSDLIRTRMPFIVRYDVPQAYAGGELCWSGTLLVADRQGLHDRSTGTRQCQVLSLENGPLSVFALSIKGNDLALRIRPPTGLRLWDVGLKAGRVVSTFLVLLILFKPQYVRLAVATAGVAASVVVLSLYSPDEHAYVYPFGDSRDELRHPITEPTFHSYRVLPPELDGFLYVALGRSILWDALNGDFYQALRGGDDVYYNMPGKRYLEAIMLAVFGDSEFGAVFFASITVVCLFYFIATFVDAFTALILCAAFIVGPRFLTQPFLFDLRLWLHIYLGHWGDGDAAIAFLMGLAILLRLVGRRIAPTVGALMAPGLLISAAIFVRPNFAAAGAAAVLCCLWQLRKSLSLSRLALVVVCFAFTGVAALHNLVFGREFVLFTTAVDVNLMAPPRAWLEAFRGWLGIGTPGFDAARKAVVEHSALWLGDLTEAGLRREFIFLRLAALILVPGLVLIRKLRTPENMTLLALVLVSHLVLLLFLNTGRHGILAWPATLLAAVIVVRELLPRLAGLFLPKARLAR